MSHPLTWRRRDLWAILQPASRGRSGRFGFTFDELSGCPSFIRSMQQTVEYVEIEHIRKWLLLTFSISLHITAFNSILTNDLTFIGDGSPLEISNSKKSSYEFKTTLFIQRSKNVMLNSMRGHAKYRWDRKLCPWYTVCWCWIIQLWTRILFKF